MTTTQELLKPFCYITNKFIKTIETDMGIKKEPVVDNYISKNADKKYTKESLSNVFYNSEITNRMTKEKYIAYCVGYIQRCVINENIWGNLIFDHNYKIPYYLYDSADEFNGSLFEKLNDMFPDAKIKIEGRNWLNYFSKKPANYSLSIRW